MKKLIALILAYSTLQCINAQNVGIGTATPQNALHINHSGSPYIRMTNTTTGATNNDGSYLGVFGRHMYMVNEESAGNQYFYTNNLLRMAIDSTGRVGIGHMPSETFDVKGDMRLESSTNSTGSTLRMYGGATGTSLIGFYRDINNPTSGATIGYNPVLDYAYISNYTSAYFTQTGLGISTISPASKFQIVNGQDAGLSASANGYMMLGSTGQANVIMDNNELMARDGTSASDFFIQHSGGNLLLCGQDAGAVGIGVASSATMPTGYKLAVDGKIISEELKVQLSGNWPDYVFADNYQLKSFDHLRSYIKENKHLPNIPSAAEVEKNGIEVGDMQKRMVEKIEELTLYILELESRMNEMEKKLNNKK